MDSKEGVLMQRYKLGKLLGQGTFAKVYHGRNLETGLSVAVKVIDKEKVLKVGMMSQIMREISVMRLVKHPNVVQLYEVMASKTKIYFVLEYVNGGELFNKVGKGKLKEDAARKYFQQLISAIDFCHRQGVYHRDLKPENILLDEEEKLKVSDFGLSALAETKRQDGLLHTTCGTPAYVAPEVLHRKGYDGAKADVWSCGVVLFVLLAGFLPFHDSNLMEMYRKIAKAEFKYPNWFPTEAQRLVSKILDPNPKTRISTAKIMENSWFRKGLDSEPLRTEIETSCLGTMVSGRLENHFGSIGATQDLGKASDLNAFDIILFSPKFNLSGLFNDKTEGQKEVRFVSKQPAITIVLKLEEIAENLKLKVMKKNGGLLKMEGSREGRQSVLAIDFEIFEISSSVHLVEAKRLGGDGHEFLKIVNDCISMASVDVIVGHEQEQIVL